jgi:3-oxoacyl-[acyl-carrier protein] reductase
MLLHDTNAMVYGAGGSLGGAVARALATAGATVFATGRTLGPLKTLAAEITSAGGQAEAAEVDALDQKAVDDYLAGIVRKSGRLGVSFNAIGLEDRQDIPLTEMALDDFIRPVRRAMETQFITSTAAGRIMSEQRSGCHVRHDGGAQLQGYADCLCHILKSDSGPTSQDQASASATAAMSLAA